MIKFYCTTDNAVDESVIVRGADVSAFDTFAEMETYLKSGYPAEDYDLSDAQIVPGRFGDCWQKWYGSKPDLASESDLLCFAPFSADELLVQAPGTHPGGNCYWVTPTPTIYVLIGAIPRD